MSTYNSRWTRINKLRKETGKRSGLEVKVAAQLDDLGVPYGYETTKIKYTKPADEKTYIADFHLEGNQGRLIIEAKGEFPTDDRKKHLLIKSQYPHLDIRFVFNNPNQRISKTSKTTYADWCNTHGFKFSKQVVPKEWLTENRCCHKIVTTYKNNYDDLCYECIDCGEETG